MSDHESVAPPGASASAPTADSPSPAQLQKRAAASDRQHDASRSESPRKPKSPRQHHDESTRPLKKARTTANAPAAGAGDAGDSAGGSGDVPAATAGGAGASAAGGDATATTGTADKDDGPVPGSDEWRRQRNRRVGAPLPVFCAGLPHLHVVVDFQAAKLSRLRKQAEHEKLMVMVRQLTDSNRVLLTDNSRLSSEVTVRSQLGRRFSAFY